MFKKKKKHTAVLDMIFVKVFIKIHYVSLSDIKVFDMTILTITLNLARHLFDKCL